MPSSDKMQSHSDGGIYEADSQIRLAYLYYDQAAKFHVQNFIFLSISVLMLISSLCFSIFSHVESVNGLAKIVVGVLSVVPSLFGIFLCIAWWSNRLRNESLLKSLYSATIDRQQRVFQGEPFLFTTAETFFSTGSISFAQSWGFVIALNFYFQLIVVVGGMWLTLLGSIH